MSEHASPLEGASFWRSALRTVLQWLWMLLPRKLRRYLATRFRYVTRSERLGYAVWGAMGVVIGVPEIWAAVEGEHFVWPTISRTVGHLQERWPVVALVPVALIVMSGHSVFRVGAASPTLQGDFKPDSQTEIQALARTAQGRLTKQDVSVEQLADRGAPALSERQQWEVLPYFIWATIAVVATALVASRSDNEFLVGYVLYSLIAVVWVIVPNVAAYWFKKDVPFTTLVFTIRCLGRRLQFVAALVAALLFILLLHLAFHPWPSPP